MFWWRLVVVVCWAGEEEMGLFNGRVFALKRVLRLTLRSEAGKVAQ